MDSPESSFEELLVLVEWGNKSKYGNPCLLDIAKFHDFCGEDVSHSRVMDQLPMSQEYMFMDDQVIPSCSQVLPNEPSHSTL